MITENFVAITKKAIMVVVVVEITTTTTTNIMYFLQARLIQADNQYNYFKKKHFKLGFYSHR